MPSAIKFENISKQYRLGLVSTRTLSHDLKRWYTMNILGQEDPYLKIGEVNDRAHKGTSEYVWALKDINFEVEQGDVLGIIGKNGAGKSTLLKILSKVTTPTTGLIKARGRIASLLEVGTGFHPEMTGRENIYMNGAIMGMTKAEINRKLDEIVDFSGVERYLDTPVKRYSSGMTVRLGFAIAAHLDPEILVVDEVLAVGDAEFQKKAIGKMQDVSKGEGRTVLFVSHNMASIRMLCNKGVILKDGLCSMVDEINSIVNTYEDEFLKKTQSSLFVNLSTFQNKSILVVENIIINEKNQNPIILNEADGNLHIKIEGKLNLNQSIALEVKLTDKRGNTLLFYCPSHFNTQLDFYEIGRFVIEKNIILPKGINSGNYYASIYLTDPGKEYLAVFEKAIDLYYNGVITKTGLSLAYDQDYGFISIG